MDLHAQGLAVLNARAWASGAGVFAVAYLLGSLICLRARIGGAADRFLIRVTAGLAVTPIVVMVAGQRSRLLFTVPWAVAGAAGLVLSLVHVYREFVKTRARGEAPPTAFSFSSHRVLQWTGWLALGATALILLGPAICPPVNYDALEYHVGVIPHFFRERAITPIPHVFYSAQPIATEMLYTLAAVLEGTPWGLAAGLVQWGLLMLAILLLARVLAALGTPPILRPWLVLLFVAHPVIYKAEIDRMTDLTGAVFLLAGILIAAAEREDLNTAKAKLGHAALMGLMAGAAVSTKWTNIGTSAVTLFLILVSSNCALECERLLSLLLRRNGLAGPKQKREQPLALQKIGIPLFGFVLGFFAILLPWIAWVWHYAGNPFAPFLARAFPTEAWGPDQLAFLLGTHEPLSPMSFSFWRNLFGRLSSFGFGPPVLALSVLAGAATLMIDRRRRADATPSMAHHKSFWITVATVAGALVGCFLWGGLRQGADRFLTPVFAAEIVVLGGALALLRSRLEPNITALLALGLAVVNLFFWPNQLAAVKEAHYWDFALGRESGSAYLLRGLIETEKFFEAVNELPRDSRSIMIGEARRYYFKGDVTLATVFDRHPIRGAIDEDPTADSIRARLQAMGFTHLVVNEFETARLLDFHPPPALMSDPQLMALRREGLAGQIVLARLYAGYSEFSSDPVPVKEHEAYVAFLKMMRDRATYLNCGSNPYPAFWIAPLAEKPKK